MLFFAIGNNLGTAQVGVISKARKYSRNTYYEIFQLSQCREIPERVFAQTRKQLFSELGTSEKTNLPLEKNPKKYLVKKVAYCRKIQRETL